MSGNKLPKPGFQLALITDQNKAMMIGLAYLVFCLLYLGAPQLAWRPPTPVTALALDNFIPLMPLAIWIYLSQFGLLFCAIWFAPDANSRSIALYSMLLAVLIAALVFILYPTVLQRNPVDSDVITTLLWKGLYLADVPGNCLPSLHAALAVLAVFPLCQREDFFSKIAPLWALAIIFSALATKQHMVLDIVTGLILALLCRLLVLRYFARRSGGLA